jgi:hypothetical protein
LLGWNHKETRREHKPTLKTVPQYSKRWDPAQHEVYCDSRFVLGRIQNCTERGYAARATHDLKATLVIF